MLPDRIELSTSRSTPLQTLLFQPAPKLRRDHAAGGQIMQAASEYAVTRGADSVSDVHDNDGHLRPADRTLSGRRPGNRSTRDPSQRDVSVVVQEVEVSTQEGDMTPKFWFSPVVDSGCPQTLAIPGK